MEKLKKILASPQLPIKQALRLMEETGGKILFIKDSRHKLLGTVSDGDIRRWILENKSLSRSVSAAMNKNPISLKVGYSIDEAKNLMVTNRIECVPVLDNNDRIVSAIWWTELFETKPKTHKTLNMPVIIMAGGEGKRLAPFTKILPKPLMPIGDKPIAEIIIERFAEYGCREFYLSVNYKSNLIKAYFSDFKHDYKINYLIEDKPLGTAGSLHMLKDKIHDTFCVSNCDVLIEADYADIMEFHKANYNKITLVGSVKHYTIPYGVCKIKSGGGLKSIDEKPEYDFLVNTGMYILEPETLNLIPAGKLYHITDLINKYLKIGAKVGVYPISEKFWLDMGQWEELQDMLKRFEVK